MNYCVYSCMSMAFTLDLPRISSSQIILIKLNKNKNGSNENQLVLVQCNISRVRNLFLEITTTHNDYGVRLLFNCLGPPGNIRIMNHLNNEYISS